MIRRLAVEWPDARPFADRDNRPIRLLVASDEPEPSLRVAENRDALGSIDGILGCGDLEPEWLAFLADAFNAPLVYVRGNHDRGGDWEEKHLDVPLWLDARRWDRISGIRIVGLEWPGVLEPGNRRQPSLAWRQAIRAARRSITARLHGRTEPLIVISHAPPAGLGDAPTDPYHAGFSAYRWLLERLRPPVWLHGHTTTALVHRLVEQTGPTIVANVTGAVLVELLPPAP